MLGISLSSCLHKWTFVHISNRSFAASPVGSSDADRAARGFRIGMTAVVRIVTTDHTRGSQCSERRRPSFLNLTAVAALRFYAHRTASRFFITAGAGVRAVMALDIAKNPLGWKLEEC
jgi:hypothetical protein